MTSPVIASPNGRFVAVWSERGLLKTDRVEDELRVYDVAALARFVKSSRKSQPPAPVVDLHEATFKQGPIISQIRWLPNSGALAFLLRNTQDTNELVILGLRQTRPHALSSRGQNVTAFNVRDMSHYVYTVAAVENVLPAHWTGGWVASDGTGQSLESILLRKEWKRRLLDFGIFYGGRLRSVLWAACGHGPRRVLKRNGQPIVIYPPQGGMLALSPNGHTMAAALPVENVPVSWARKFAPPFAGDPYDVMHVGRQDLDLAIGDMFVVTNYALIDLRSGAVTSIGERPTGTALGWWTLSGPAWSDNGKGLLLPDIYVRPVNGRPAASSPCVAIFNLVTSNLQCLRSLASKIMPGGAIRTEQDGFLVISSLRFADGKSNTVVMRYFRISDTLGNAGLSREVFVRSQDGAWKSTNDVPRTRRASVNLYIKQGLNAPPVVVATERNTGVSRVVWDPNPQLQRTVLGDAIVYHWRDSSGNLRTGGLYKPASYVAGVRYPLVIQTHGFVEKYFLPSGWAPTAFAARALAASGIVVLQVQECSHVQDLKFGPCEVDMYESGVKHLASSGVIDPKRVGIIGFSQTVFPVLDALTADPERFAAASVTDGPSYGYWAYLSNADSERGQYARVADATIGAEPFGAGLRVWQQRAPDFNLQRVRAPLLVNSLGLTSLLEGMWEPYAALRYLHKPVDLVLLNSDEHVLTSPAVRLASQGGSVDWFRFWLQGYESPHPVIPGEYLRWERLCDAQIEENPGRATWCVPTKRYRSPNSKAAQAAH